MSWYARRAALFALLIALLSAGRLRSGGAQSVVTPGTTYEVPYRLTQTKHFLIRAKLNGKGPFNFLMDTGAPALIFTKALAQKIGVPVTKNPWVVVNRLELEGGTVLEKVSARLDDPFQLRAMNTTGLMDSEIAGVLGYTVLAHFRIEIVPDSLHMRWTLLDYVPPRVPSLQELTKGKPLKMPRAMTEMTNMARSASSLFPRAASGVVLRGFIGIELTEDTGKTQIANVLAESPAAAAGLRTGDIVQRIEMAGQAAQEITKPDGLYRAMAKVSGGTKMTLRVLRDNRPLSLTLTTGKAEL